MGDHDVTVVPANSGINGNNTGHFDSGGGYPFVEGNSGLDNSGTGSSGGFDTGTVLSGFVGP